MNSNVINNILRQIIITGIFALPFIFLPNFNMETYFPFIVGKNFSFRIITGIIFTVWLILAIRDHSYLPKKSYLAYALAGFLGVMAISTVFSENSFKSFWSNYERMEGYITLLHLAGYFLVAGTVLAARKIWDTLFHVSLGMGLFMSLFTFLQMGGELLIQQGIGRVDGTLGNAAYLGVYLLVHIFIAAFYFVNRREKEDAKGVLLTMMIGFGLFVLYYIFHAGSSVYEAKWLGTTLSLLSVAGGALATYYRFGVKAGNLPLVIRSSAYAVIIGLLTFSLIKTETRGSILGFAIAGTLVAAGLTFMVKDRPRLKRVSIGVLVAIVLFFAGIGIFKNTAIVENNSSLRRIGSLLTTEVSKFAATEGKSRFAIWNTAFKGFLERPVFGWGQESFNYVFYKHYNPKMYDQEAWFDRAHNVFLDWLIAGGLLGLLGYLSLFGLVVWYLWKKKGEFAFTVEEKVVLTGLLIAYFIHNLFVFDNIGSYLLFFTLLAFIHANYAEGWSWIKDQAKKQDEVLVSIGVPAIIVLGVFGVYWFNVPSFANAYALNSALDQHPKGISENIRIFKGIFEKPTVATYEAREQITMVSMRLASANVDASVRNEIFNMAYSEMKKQLVETPKDARYWYFMGGLLSTYGRYSEALAVWEKAVELAPKKQMMLFALASTNLQLGNRDAAIKAFKEAYEVYPANEEAALQYFAVSGQTGKVVELIKARVEKYPDDVNVQLSYAIALAEDGQKAKSIEEIRKVIGKVPEFKTQGEDLIKQIQQGKIKKN